MSNRNATAFASFAALALGTKLWFRQNDIPSEVGLAPVEAVKVRDDLVVITKGRFGWPVSEGTMDRKVTAEMLAPAEKLGPYYKGFYIFNMESKKLQVWTSDPTAKKPRVKKVRPSLCGQRFTIMTLPEELTGILKTGMKGTMVTTGSEAPLVVLDGYSRTVHIHVSHLGIHKRRPKMTMDRLPPQTREVLSLLKAKGSLTAIEAGGVIRARSLAKRISELKEAGTDIITETKHDHTGQRYARYHLKIAA